MIRKIKIKCIECDSSYEVKITFNDHPVFCCFCGEELPNNDEYEDEYDDE